jgi:hypothetical protein
MNRTTLEKLGEPNALKVFFDPTNSRFGVKPCHESSSHAFKLCKAGRYGARRISVLPALIERRIDIRETVQFMDPEFDEDGMLVLDLRSAKVTNRVSNHWSRRKGLPKDV